MGKLSDNHDWYLRQIEKKHKLTRNEFLIRAFVFLDLLCYGLHHVQVETMLRSGWVSTRYLKVELYETGVATVDYDMMTRIVFLAHDLCVRAEIQPYSRGKLVLFLSERHREGNFCQRHPTIDQALEKWRENYPADFMNPPEKKEVTSSVASDPVAPSSKPPVFSKDGVAF